MELNENKLLVLDLDETLLFTEYASEKDFDFIVCDNFMVKKRPFLDEFLNAVFEIGYKIAIWTASTEKYAKEIVANLFGKDYEQKLEFVYSRSQCNFKNNPKQSCFSCEKIITIKNLKKIWRKKSLKAKWNKTNTFVLDDNNTTFSKNYGNSIPIPAWSNHFLYKDDDALKRLIPLLRIWKSCANVRLLDKQFWYSNKDEEF